MYSNNPASRPNTPINFILGAMIIGTIQGLSKEELIESILFDIRYQYTLHTINSLLMNIASVDLGNEFFAIKRKRE